MGMNEIRERHKEAVAQFGQYYEPKGPFQLPHLKIGVQSFALHYETDDPRHDDEHREWLGIMLAAALKRLVEEQNKNEP